jgi:hypothetical protein
MLETTSQDLSHARQFARERAYAALSKKLAKDPTGLDLLDGWYTLETATESTDWTDAALQSLVVALRKITVGVK